jgi:hypothetical protein
MRLYPWAAAKLPSRNVSQLAEVPVAERLGDVAIVRHGIDLKATRSTTKKRRDRVTSTPPYPKKRRSRPTAV